MAVPLHLQRHRPRPSGTRNHRHSLSHRTTSTGRGAVGPPQRLPLVHLCCALSLAALLPLALGQCDVGINYSGGSLDVGSSIRILRNAGFKSIKTFAQNTDVFNALAGETQCSQQ